METTLSNTTVVKISTSTGVRLSFILGSRMLAEYEGVPVGESRHFLGEEGVNFIHRPLFLQHFQDTAQELIKTLFKLEQEWETAVAPTQPMVSGIDYKSDHVPYNYFVLEIGHYD